MAKNKRATPAELKSRALVERLIKYVDGRYRQSESNSLTALYEGVAGELQVAVRTLCNWLSRSHYPQGYTCRTLENYLIRKEAENA